MTIKVGDKIPSVSLATMKEGAVTPITTDEIFKGKKVVMFGVPGAFTPTCAQKHLPSYVKGAGALKKDKKVDEIVCIAVNDVFVMDAWGRDQDVGDKILMLADGSAQFAKAAGLELDLTAKGLGVRCQRFSLVAEDGVVKSITVEPNPGALDKTACEIVAKTL